MHRLSCAYFHEICSLTVVLNRTQARGLLEAEDMLRAAAAAAAATPASVSDGKEGEEGACGESAAITTEAAAESLASLPRVVLRPVPLPALCWCVDA